ncbi:MAG TPA: class I SAM-dependent methyltransferase [Pantanalinema sp.]
MKRLIKSILRMGFVGGPLLALIKGMNQGTRAAASLTHQLQLIMEWQVLPNPEWFDHNIDLYNQWRKTRTPLIMERGCYNLLAIKKGGTLLELCCGDGFISHYFYSHKVAHMIAVDFDPAAVRHASIHHAGPNISFQLADIRQSLPEGEFDNVVWDAAIAHFTPEETSAILRNIRSRLKPGGILSGSTIVKREDGKKSLHQHEYEFKSREDLVGVLSPHFENVCVFETLHEGRRNLYFYASDGILPLESGWPSMTRASELSKQGA